MNLADVIARQTGFDHRRYAIKRLSRSHHAVAHAHQRCGPRLERTTSRRCRAVAVFNVTPKHAEPQRSPGFAHLGARRDGWPAPAATPSAALWRISALTASKQTVLLGSTGWAGPAGTRAAWANGRRTNLEGSSHGRARTAWPDCRR